MLGRVLTVCMALLVASISEAAADDEKKKQTRIRPRGPYLQLTGGIQSVTGESGIDATIGGKIGVDIIDWVALEAEFEGSRDARRFVATLQQRSAFLRGRFKPFVVGGIGIARVTQNEGTPQTDNVTAVALRFGGGADYWLSKHVAMSLQASYVIIANGLSDHTSVGLGLRYAF
ncbi:porin family protein [Myxococcota bacterium]|nr:porin family protein [Myxococcota bacterium]